MRKSSSDKLFMLERDVSLAGNLTKLRICAQELLSAKVKRRISSNGYLYLQLKITMGFPTHKVKEIPTLNYHHTVGCGKHRAARI